MFKNKVTVEESLLGVFKKGKRAYKKLTTSIFKNELQINFDNIFDVPYIDDDDLIWRSKKNFYEITNKQKYSIFCSVWCRVNLTNTLSQLYLNQVRKKKLILAEKIELFQNNHKRIADYIDTIKDPCDDNLNIDGLYTPLGISPFDDDREYIKLVKEEYVVRETPITVLKKHYPHLDWTLDDITTTTFDFDFDPIKPEHCTHTIYYKCLTLMQQCKDCYDIDGHDELYFYYVSFVELFNYCLPTMSDAFLLSPIGNTIVSPLKLFFPYDYRTFTCWDLPNMYHVLVSLSLKGEQSVAATTIEELLQKALPFCGQRRTLVKKFRLLLKREDCLTNILKQLFWCMLANLYPDTKKDFNMHRLMKIKHITDKAENIDKCFDILKNGKPNIGCNIIFLSLRSWMYVMTYDNTQYGELISDYIDWKSFILKTKEMLEAIQIVDLYDENRSFADMVIVLDNCGSVKVNRYKTSDLKSFLLKHIEKNLEKNVYSELAATREDKKKISSSTFDIRDLENSPLYDNFTTKEKALMECDRKEKILDCDISSNIKNNIFKFLQHMTSNEKMNQKSVSSLMLKEYGGVQYSTAIIFMGMIDVYKTTSKPSDINKLITFIPTVYDLKVLCWYLTVVLHTDNIKYELLDVTTVKDIDSAMVNVKYKNIDINKSVFDVFSTVCCQRINTHTGSTAYGHKDMYYDVVENQFLCARLYKNKKKDSIATNEFEKEKIVRKRMRSQRRDYTSFSCETTPVTKRNLRGLKMSYGLTEKKKVTYMHCPRCASFHIYSHTNWGGSLYGQYRCEECISKEVTSMLFHRCFHCNCQLTRDDAKKHTLFLKSLTHISVHKYFCKKHWMIAKYICKKYFDVFLEHKIKEKEEKKIIKFAGKY